LPPTFTIPLVLLEIECSDQTTTSGITLKVTNYKTLVRQVLSGTLLPGQQIPKTYILPKSDCFCKMLFWRYWREAMREDALSFRAAPCKDRIRVDHRK